MQMRTQKGSGLLELLIGIAIVALVLVSTMGALGLYAKAGLQNTEKIQAAFLLEEGVEAVRYLRDSGWSSFAGYFAGTTYYPLFTGGEWTLSTSEVVVDSTFTRTVVFDHAYRRSSDNDLVPVSTSGSYLDPRGRKAIVTVAWNDEELIPFFFDSGLIDGDLGNFPSNNFGTGDLAQQFRVGSDDVDAHAIELPLRRVGAPSDIYLELYIGSQIGTVVATSNTIASASIPDNQLLWTRFIFPERPRLGAGTEYYIRLRSVPSSTEIGSGSNGTIHWGYGGPGNPIPSMAAFRYVGAGGDPSDTGEHIIEYDFSFRVITFQGEPHVFTYETYFTDLTFE